MQLLTHPARPPRPVLSSSYDHQPAALCDSRAMHACIKLSHVVPCKCIGRISTQPPIVHVHELGSSPGSAVTLIRTVENEGLRVYHAVMFVMWVYGSTLDGAPLRSITPARSRRRGLADARHLGRSAHVCRQAGKPPDLTKSTDC